MAAESQTRIGSGSVSIKGASRSGGSTKLSRSGMWTVCPCPGPPPPHRDMMSRYYNLETGLRSNWASMHEAANDLGSTRGDAGGELESMVALAKSQADEVQRRADLEEAEHYAVHEWRATTISRSPRVGSEMSSQVFVPEFSPKASVDEDPRIEGEPRANHWKIQSRDHVKETCSPICLKEQAEQRWEYLFGDTQVAFAPPGTGVAAFSGGTKTSKFRFSCSSGWQGLKRGDVFTISARASNPGPMSSITLPEEADKRAAHMLSMGSH
eukprot:TRINITY_DN111793_c0_g1_i1.p1 TRINITY_DN111793_c0_g1~~TRINITY_DN111793_c0_g1_i1.p1  ORF type:complete len:282 (+),score=42.10 TRINITY_DN111793_c0_g1_i1:44-847(+)